MSRTIDILERLVGFDTTSAQSNLALVDYAHDHLAGCGFEVHRVPDASGLKAGLFAAIGPPGAGVLLSAHTDTVPVEGQDWTRDPFRPAREDGRVYGRGTTDMKGFVACVLALAERAARVRLTEPLKIALSYDEEVGCVGIQHMIGALDRTIGQPRACVVGEPTAMRVAVGHKGKAALRAVFHGLGGHSALAPKLLNALHLAGDFMAQLRRIQDTLAMLGARDPAYAVAHSTVHVGRLTGGTALNIVPDRAEMLFEYRHLAADDPGDILARINQAAAAVAAAYRAAHPAARIEIDQYNAYPGLEVAEDAPVTVLAGRLARSPEVIKVDFGTEAGVFMARGIPTVVCGPGSMAGQGHKADEYVTTEQLAACDRMLDRLLAELSA